jgi:anti-anti-sigma factor
MQIAEAKKNGVMVVSVDGRIDASNAPTLEQKLLALIAGGEKRLVIDCTQLEYVSSAGLRVLLVAAKRLSGDGTLGLAALNKQIHEVFDIAGFSSIFQIYRTQDEAIAAVQ